VERGDVGEPDDPFGLVAEARRPYAMSDSIQTVAAPCGDDGAGLAIAQGFGQLRGAASVRPRQETVSLEQPRPEHDVISMTEPAEPLQHERTVEWPRGGYDPNSVAWAERSGNDHG